MIQATYPEKGTPFPKERGQTNKRSTWEERWDKCMPSPRLDDAFQLYHYAIPIAQGLIEAEGSRNTRKRV